MACKIGTMPSGDYRTENSERFVLAFILENMKI